MKKNKPGNNKFVPLAKPKIPRNMEIANDVLSDVLNGIPDEEDLEEYDFRAVIPITNDDGEIVGTIIYSSNLLD